MNLGDSGGYSNSQYYENTPFFSNPSQVDVTENIQTTQDTKKQPRGKAWDVAEDVALISSWCLVSENSIRGNNQKATSLWAEVKKLYDEAQVENPEKIGKRNVQQMKGRYKRLNESVQKWVGAYREAYRRMKIGMSQKDVESEAHKIYEQEVKNKFCDSVVFNEVMCNHPKWELQLHRDTTRSRPEEVEDGESGGSTKRTRTTEEGDYSNPETPNSGASTIQRPIGRDEAKKKRKGKASDSLVEELQELRLRRDTEIELFKIKLDMDQEKHNIMKEREHQKKERENQREQREMKKMQLEQEREMKKLQLEEEREMKKMQLMHLNTLLAKEHLSQEDEDMKKFLLSKFYGK